MEKKTLVPAYKAYRTQVFYHKSQFEEAGITKIPETWDEFIAVCDQLQEKGYTPLMGVGASDIWATAFWLLDRRCEFRALFRVSEF